MATSRRALLPAALCCVALAGCPQVQDVKGTAYRVAGANQDPLGSEPVARDARAIEPGDQLQENGWIAVADGSSVTVEFSDDCTRTFGPGTHVVSSCDDDHDDDRDDDNDHDRDRDDDEERDRDDRDRQDTDSTDSPPSNPANAAQPGVAGHPSGVLGATSLTTVGTLVGTSILVGGIIEETRDDDEDDAPPPLSP